MPFKTRYIFFTLLLGLAPMGYFLAFYLGGVGILSVAQAFILGSISMFICPLIVSIVCVVFCKVNWAARITFFIASMIVQIIFFKIVPDGATSEMMGIAHKFRREFSTEQLRDCANQLRMKLHTGTLTLGDKGKNDYLPITDSAVTVADSELPISLRGHFEHVFIQKDPSTGDEQVIFALGFQTGIICDNEKNIHEPYVYSMADGVEAYRYEP